MAVPARTFRCSGSAPASLAYTERLSLETDTGIVRAGQVIMATHLQLGQVGLFHAHNSPHMHAVMAVPVDPARAPTGMYISTDQPKRSVRSHRAAF